MGEIMYNGGSGNRVVSVFIEGPRYVLEEANGGFKFESSFWASAIRSVFPGLCISVAPHAVLGAGRKRIMF
ncbi:MAG: hypothetical protein ACYTBJ_27385 [Planctomycetota bacterium]